MERSEVHDALSKAESLVSSLEEEKKKLTEELKNVIKYFQERKIRHFKPLPFKYSVSYFRRTIPKPNSKTNWQI